MGTYCPQCGATITGHYPVCVACGAALKDDADLPPIAPWIPSLSKSWSEQPLARAIMIALSALAVVVIATGIRRLATAPATQAAHPAPIHAKAPSIDATGPGVAVYPGARLEHHSTQLTRGRSAITTAFTTTDSLDNVVDFYLDRLGSGALVSQSSQSALFAASSPDRKNSVMLTISLDPGGQTRIAILHSLTS